MSLKKFDAIKHLKRKQIDDLRSLILSLDPKIEELWKWNAPSYTLDGNNICTFRLQPKQQFELILHKGSKSLLLDQALLLGYEVVLVYKSHDRAVIFLNQHVLDEIFYARLKKTISEWMVKN